MTARSLSTSLLVAGLALGLSGPLAAAEGRFTFARDVRVGTPSGEQRPVSNSETQDSARAALYRGEQIETGVAGNARWWMVDESQFALARGSTFRIDDYQTPRGSEGAGVARYTLVKGAFRSISGTIGKRSGDRYVVTTSRAELLVNGTDFWVIDCRGNCRVPGMAAVKDGLYVGVNEGEVTVSNAEGRLVLQAGQSALVASPPVLIDAPAVYAMFAADLSLGGGGGGGGGTGPEIILDPPVIEPPVSPN
ncbi:MAG TPA: FecR domain-containing protein [Nevskiaceae bacterium]|nr:FecR domain-containing protein [Nevskiaceae bacterium]